MAVWGPFVAPKASRRLEDPGRLVVEVVVFGAGALALLAGELPLVALLAAPTMISLTLMFSFGQRGL